MSGSQSQIENGNKDFKFYFILNSSRGTPHFTMNIRSVWICFGVLLLTLSGCSSKKTRPQSNSNLPEGFVYLHEIDPSIIEEMRYAGDHNFVGRPIEGYLSGKCILTREAAQSLSQAQAEVRNFSMTFKVYDCYRPQRAVNDFVSWAANPHDTQMKGEFYPKLDKSTLFSGYIAKRSGHSRGSTIDLTLVPLPLPTQAQYQKEEKLISCFAPASERFQDNSLDFGTGYDCFDPLAHTANPALGPSQKRNRLMLKSVLEKFGFKNYENEWWHFTLKNEPFPDQYFDFPVK